jgi:LCP family protein required for cell wall assembly
MGGVAVGEDVLPLREDDPDERRRERRRSRRVLVVALLLLALPVALVVGGAWFVGSSLDGSVDRIPGAFDIPESERPQQPEPGSKERPQVGTTFLLAGTDRRSEELTTGEGAAAPSWLPGAQRSDAIMLAHVTEDGDRAYVVSIPRDSWVDIPGYGPNKVNAAFSFGGPSLYVQTIEQLTDTRINHLAVIDWTGLTQLVDALGGVDLTFTTETVARDRTWPAGTHTLSGEEVLAYVGERYALPRGDFDRVERQQAVIRSLGQKLISQGVLTNPTQALDVARAVAQAVSVDESLDVTGMVRLALASRGLRPDDITFMTVPTAGVGFEGSQSVVYLDQARQDGFWRAFRTDRLEQWVERNGARTTPDTVS